MTEDLLATAIEHLKRLDFACERQTDNSFDIFVRIEETDVCLECRLPMAFPYTFPLIYLKSPFLHGIPHIIRDGEDSRICTFDAETTIPNFFNSNALIAETVNKAIQIISSGIRKENLADFADEIREYWGGYPAYSFVDFSESISYYKYIEAKEAIFIAENVNALNDILKKIGCSGFPIRTCLYLPSLEPMEQEKPFPNGALEFYDYVRKSEAQFSAYTAFLKEDVSDFRLILFREKNHSIVQGWLQHTIKAQKGFRNGHGSVGLALRDKNSINNIIRVSLKDARQIALFNRGGLGLLSNFSKASVIGCGSIGSFLAEALVQAGIADLQLIDNQIITIDNIARHLCGMNYVGKSKTDSIKHTLELHNPNVTCLSVKEDAFEILSGTDFGFIGDWLFVAVGSTPLEHRLVELYNQQVIKCPLIILWVEPFVAAGHAIIIRKPQDVFTTLFDMKDMSFIRRVIKEPLNFTKREAGCQSSYIPYSGVDVKHFLYSFLAYFVDQILSEQDLRNYLFSWTGNLDRIRQKNIEICDSWSAYSSYTKVVERID